MYFAVVACCAALNEVFPTPLKGARQDVLCRLCPQCLSSMSVCLHIFAQRKETLKEPFTYCLGQPCWTIAYWSVHPPQRGVSTFVGKMGPVSVVPPSPPPPTQAHRGPRSQGSDHGSKSQRAGTEKRAGERLLPSRSNSTRKGTHHVVKRPDQAGRRGPARGPMHLHPSRDTTVNPTTTRSYVEVVRGVAQRSGRPATVRGPPHVTRYILLPRAPTHPPQPPSAQQRHEGEGRGFVLRSPKDGLSAGTWRRKVVMCPRRGNDPASGHPRAHQPPLGRGTSPPAWDGRLDAPGQRRRHLPSSAWTRRREVKQGKSGGSVGTSNQGKGKGRSVVRPMGTVAYRGKGQGKGKGRGEGRLGQGGRGRSKGGEKLMGTTAYGGKGSKGRAANGDRPVGAASCRRDHHTMASCQNPHLLHHNTGTS